MSFIYYDFSAAVNGDGSSATPYNLTGWNATTVTPGNHYMFKRGTTLTTAFQTVAGTNNSTYVQYGAWYNSDGSDDATKPKPIVITTSTFSTYSSTNKDWVTIDNWDIRAWGIPVASDTYVIFLGSGASVTNCTIYSTCGAIGSFGKSNVVVTGNTLYGVAHGASYSNCVLTVSDTATVFGVTITKNRIYHLGGGNANSHACRCECSSASGALNVLVFDGNIIGPAPNAQRLLPGNGHFSRNRNIQALLPGVGIINETSIDDPASPPTYCANKSAIGLWADRCPSAQITNNTITGMLEGIFLNGGGTNTTGVVIGRNVCNYNRHFGIHLSTLANNCTVERNTTSYNGTSILDIELYAYGRGIELSSAQGQGMCSGHTIRFNTCEYNKNYGGPNDNGSEGVGIGLDDGASGCNVYGNTLRYNEGNGIQLYGGVVGTDTANTISGNLFTSNCTASYTNRRSGGVNPNLFCASLQASGTFGSRSNFVNNVFTGTTPAGIAIDNTCNRITIANNIFIDVPHAIMIPTTGWPSFCGSFRNDFYSNLVAIQQYCSNAVNGVGSPTYPNSLYGGTGDVTTNPLLDTNYKPTTASTMINAGYTPGGTFYDFNFHTFDTPPTIGMYELIASPTTYYVSTTGSDTNNGKSTAQALLTISKGAQLAAAGDTIYVLAGNYQGPLYIDNTGTYADGTSAAPITLQSLSKGAAAIRALAQPASGGGNNAAVEIRTSNWVIDGFEVTGEDGYTNTADTSWNYNATTEWIIGILLYGSNNVVKNCYIHDLGRGSQGTAYGGAGIKMDTALGGNTNRAYANTLYRIGSAANPDVHGIYLGTTACEAHSNIVGNCFAGACIAAINGATQVVIANNTCFQSNAGLMWGQTGTAAAAPWMKDSVAFNNIFVSCSSGVLEAGNIGTGNIFSTNLFWNCTGNVTNGSVSSTANVSLDPLFVNYIATGNGDYRLSAGSSAIGGGTASVAGHAVLTYDVSGNARPTSATYDLGALEFATVAAAASTSPVNQPDHQFRKRLRRH